MGKNSAYKCTKCGALYSKKLMQCPQCNCVNERKMEQVAALEIKASHNPGNGLRCKQCGTIFPDDIPKCPYCARPSTNAIQLSLIHSQGIIETPVTKHYGKTGYALKFRAGNSQAANENTRPVPCAVCKRSISPKAESCPHCGQPTGIHVCPKCGSTKTKIISGASKATSIYLWGLFAANKVLSKFQCKDCGHKW